jgi:predicted metal-dependent phosphoesterase TrpH
LKEPSLIFDLHCHSNQSDGILSPDALLSRAKQRGVDVLALTDHDTIAGLASAQQAAREQGVQLINGIEFSSQWGKNGVHIVGLGVDTSSSVLLGAIESQQTARSQRALAIAERLYKAGFSGALEGAQRIAGEALLGRPHFAQYLVDIGAVKNMNSAFKKYLGAGKPADVKYQWPDMQQVIEWIHGAAGVAVLAHPCKYDLTRTKMCALIGDFAAAGGDALEIISGQQASGVADDLARIAQANGLYASCGSDFHMPDQPWHELGNFGTLPAQCRPVWQLLGFAA